MNRPRERAIINGVCQRHGVSRETCPHYAMLVEALLTEGVDEVIRGRMTDEEVVVPPAIAALKRAGWHVDRSVWGDVEKSVRRNGIPVGELEPAARAWVLKGWRKGNVDGLIDFVVNGGAEAARPGAPRSNAPRELPDDPAKW